MAKGKSSKDKLKEIAVEAITLQGPMTSRQISDYAIDNHKAVRWIPHRLAIPGILASDKRFVSDNSKRKQWKLRG